MAVDDEAIYLAGSLYVPRDRADSFPCFLARLDLTGNLTWQTPFSFNHPACDVRRMLMKRGVIYLVGTASSPERTYILKFAANTGAIL